MSKQNEVWPETELETRIAPLASNYQTDVAAIKAQYVVENRNLKEKHKKEISLYENKNNYSSKLIIGMGCLGIIVAYYIMYLCGSAGYFNDISDEKGYALVPVIGFLGFGIGIIIGLIISSFAASIKNRADGRKKNEINRILNVSLEEANRKKEKALTERRNQYEAAVNEIQNKFNASVCEYIKRFSASESANKLTSLLVNEIQTAISKADHADYIKKINIHFWFHVYFDRMDIWANEVVEDQGKKKELLKRQVVFKHELIRNLESYEQIDALVEVLMKQTKAEIMARDGFAVIQNESKGERCLLDYKTPNSEVKSYTGW